MMKRLSSIGACGVLMLVGAKARAQATPATQAPIFLAEIESFTLEPGCTGDYCAATIVAGGESVTLPRNLLIDLPANRLTAAQIFAQAPASCLATGESGLAARDRCTGGRGGFVTLAANRTRCGEVIAGDVLIQKGLTAIDGVVTFINYAEGWFRLDGVRGDATQGAMVRFNDPSGTHSIQAGAGCNGGPNCSPDPRFTNDPVNYTIAFLSGYPLCIPSTVVPVNASNAFTTPRRAGANPTTGVGDAFCPDTNRPSVALDPVAADSTRFAPLKVDDNVFVNGSMETIGGVQFLSAHTVQVNVGLMTRDDPTQPDYLQIIETVWDMPSFGRNRVRFRALGQGSLPAPTPLLGNDVDLFALRVDPRDNASHLDPLASTFNNPQTKGLGNRPTGVNIWRITYDVTFPPLPERPEQPCTNLRNAGLLVGAAANKCANGGTLQENFAVLSPVSREVVARTRHKSAAVAAAAQPGGLPVPETLNIVGGPANQGEYLRPLGISLGGIEPPPGIEFDLNLAAQPFVFEALPWLLDRRVGPTGCPLGGCEPLSTFPIGTLVATPFPFSGRAPDDVVTGVLTAPTTVPVPGRPATFFQFDTTAQLFATAVLPIPVDTQCARSAGGWGSVRPEDALGGSATAEADAGGCTVSRSRDRSHDDAAWFGVGTLALWLASRIRRRAPNDESRTSA